MRLFATSLLLIVVTVFISASVCLADQREPAGASSASSTDSPNIAKLMGIPEEYPGLTRDKLMMVNVAVLQAKEAMHAYYMLNGFWPASWQAVVDAGLFTAPLLTPFGEVINPDDQEVNCNYDILFNPEGQSPPQLATFDESRGKFTYQEMPVGSIPLSYRNRQSKSQLTPDGPVPQLLQYADNHEMLSAVAIGSVLQGMLVEAWQYSGREVNSWDAFVASGYFPHASDSVNPLTGKTWAADGAPGSLVLIPSPGGNSIPQLRLVDPETGEHIWLIL